MIPKIIHYCWFGGNPLPDSAKEYIESWKKYCPDYIIKEWNENNFDINSNLYVKQAYEAKKWAFVSDYVRLYALVNEGGVYMDTDVELTKPIDRFLEHKAFSGYEKEDSVPTGIMACEKGFRLFSEFLGYYDNKAFIDEEGKMDLTTNVVTITRICKLHGFILDGNQKSVEDFVIYPVEYFCPKDYVTGQINCTDNTYAIHHFSGSWLDKNVQKELNIIRKLSRVFNGRLLKSPITKTIICFYAYGFKATCKKIKKKVLNKT